MSERRALLDWYDREKRDLPWRRSRDPWAIWVSEVMLQQTRAEVAAPYFERFLARFPTARALAEASEEEALAHWSGLGYYRRARLLRAAAAGVVASGGELPSTATELERLPGVGPYTAAAIASIAFGEPVAVLDGNVARVVARRLGTIESPARARVRKQLLEAAAELLEPSRAGDSNQALMELGATICTPKAPLCERCPLARACRARALSLVEQIPVARAQPRAELIHQVAARVVDDRGRWLLVRRDASETLLPGLWELPTQPGTRPDAARFAASFGGSWSFACAASASARHAITRFRIRLSLWPATWRPAGVAERPETRWFAPGADETAALTGITRKLLVRAAPAGEP